MSDFYPRVGEPEPRRASSGQPPDADGAGPGSDGRSDASIRLRWQIVDALRRYGTDASKVAHEFASRQQLQDTDLQALVAIMSAEGGGTPLTPSGLRAHLGLSSAGTTYVIDRLAAAGHVERVRDHATDRRVVHLRYTAQGQATALQFFGPLGDQTERVMDRFTDDELATVSRFLDLAAQSMHEHLDHLQRERRQDP